MDPLTVEDMFFAADLALLGCDLMADQICSAKTHDEAACLVMACRELIEATANPKLLELIVATDETNFRELRRRELLLNREQAQQDGR